MSSSIIEIGKVSSRGQVAIPQDIREGMHLKEGDKLLFVFEGDSLLIKKVSEMSWEEVTRPLREAAKKSGFKEKDIPELIHRFRAKKRSNVQ